MHFKVFLLSIFAFVQVVHYLGGFKANLSPASVSIRPAPYVSGRTTCLHSMINVTSPPAVDSSSSSFLESFRSPFHKYYPVNCSAVFRGNTSEIRRIGKLFHDYKRKYVVPSDLEVSMMGRSEKLLCTTFPRPC